MRKKEREDVAKTFSCDENVDKAVKVAVHNALAKHRAKGNLVAIWKDGKPIWITPEEDSDKNDFA